MTPTISPELVEVIDVHGARRRHASGIDDLQQCRVEQWGLEVEYDTPHASDHAAEHVWLLPEIGLRLTRFRPRRRHSRPSASLLTAAHIEADTSSWACADLLLGLELPEQRRPRIVRSEEFGTAVAAGRIRSHEADTALRTMHRILAELSTHGDLDSWLAANGIGGGPAGLPAPRRPLQMQAHRTPR
ncbi:hypothetical protein [Bounagaea algeriensis]